MKYLKYFEDIKIHIKVGDTVLGGRFKNKKILVKKIGKNKKGDVTINGKPLLRFRIIKESNDSDVDYYLSHLEDDGFRLDFFNEMSGFRIYKPIKSSIGYTYSNCKKYKWSEIQDEVYRYIKSIDNKNIKHIFIIRERDPISLDDMGYSREILTIDDVLNNRVSNKIISFVVNFK